MPRSPVEDREKRAVLRTLRRGKARSVSAREIALATNLLSDRTDVKVRTIISALIEDGYPIGSWSGGYYLIETTEELEEVLEGIRVRIRGMQRRLREISRNFSEASQ